MLSRLVAALLAIGALEEPQPPRSSARASAAAPALTVRQAVGQHMIFAYDGLTPPAALQRRIARGEAAGVIIFARNVRSAGQLRAAMRRLQAIRRPAGLRAPLIVMADQEGGPVRRIPGAPTRAAAEVGSTAQARADGEGAARTLRAAGMNMDLAPVADVGRAGRRAHARAAHVRPLTEHRGQPRERLRRRPARAAACAPPPSTSPASARPRSTPTTPPSASTRRWRRCAAPTCRRSRASSTTASTRSCCRPRSTRRSTTRPAAFSRQWVTGELRERLGFEGVAITDDLGTPAVAAFGSNRARAVLAVEAGIDLPLFSSSYQAGAQAAEGLLAAAGDGRLDATRAARTGAPRARATRPNTALG